jgi:hypothetical protein
LKAQRAGAITCSFILCIYFDNERQQTTMLWWQQAAITIIFLRHHTFFQAAADFVPTRSFLARFRQKTIEIDRTRNNKKECIARGECYLFCWVLFSVLLSFLFLFHLSHTFSLSLDNSLHDTSLLPLHFIRQYQHAQQ